MAVNYYIKLFLTDTEVYSGIFMSVLLLVAETIKNWWVEIILFQKIPLICYKMTWSPSSEWCSVLPYSFLLVSWKEYTHACFNKRKKKISRLIVTIQIALKLFHEYWKWFSHHHYHHHNHQETYVNESFHMSPGSEKQNPPSDIADYDKCGFYFRINFIAVSPCTI